MLVRLLKDCVVSGYPGVQVGDIFEVEQELGRNLVFRGILTEITAVKAPEVIQAREPVVQTRDPEPKRSRKQLP
jgi:hypothetical protein